MLTKIQYYTDEKGNKISVIISFKDWKKLNSRLENLQNKLGILTSVQNGINEVKESRKTGRKLQSLTDFIDESRS
ncbi:MAG: hypothetical protein M3525_07565 [Acidobacteriota bacterium]|nr:hypothetical protein [Acidobacteriota bacterium]